MTFKIGDMVRIIEPPPSVRPRPDPGAVGKIGVITAPYVDYVNEIRYGRAWEVTLPEGDRWAVIEQCLRLIPSDSEGRKVVDWNWRDLLEKQPCT